MFILAVKSNDLIWASYTPPKEVSLVVAFNAFS